LYIYIAITACKTRVISPPHGKEQKSILSHAFIQTQNRLILTASYPQQLTKPNKKKKKSPLNKGTVSMEGKRLLF
jgi:hypothetical protein